MAVFAATRNRFRAVTLKAFKACCTLVIRIALAKALRKVYSTVVILAPKYRIGGNCERDGSAVRSDEKLW